MAKLFVKEDQTTKLGEISGTDTRHGSLDAPSHVGSITPSPPNQMMRQLSWCFHTTPGTTLESSNVAGEFASSLCIPTSRIILSTGVVNTVRILILSTQCTLCALIDSNNIQYMQSASIHCVQLCGLAGSRRCILRRRSGFQAHAPAGQSDLTGPPSSSEPDDGFKLMHQRARAT